MTQRNVRWIGVFLMMLGTIGCERRSNEIDYRGERIKLTKAYVDYDDYKNDPENICCIRRSRRSSATTQHSIRRTGRRLLPCLIFRRRSSSGRGELAGQA
jgi:hypothetical protein